MTLALDDIENRFFEILTSWSNPVILFLFVFASILLVIYFLNRYLVKPLEEKHIIEKKEIELRNSRLMALFSELDPDPVVRVDVRGKVNFFNDAAKDLLQLSIDDLILEKILNISGRELIEKIEMSDVYSFPFTIQNKHYNVLLKGNSNLGIAQLYFRNISEIKNLELKLKQLSSHLQNQIDEERYRIANELHDGIIQELYFSQLNLGKLSESFSEKENEELSSVQTQLKETTEELRRIIYDLKPKILDEMGLGPALKSLCNNVIKGGGLSGSVEVIGLDERLDKKIEIYFYRLVQEAITNIVKHSGASEFYITLVKDNNIIRVMIADNGTGLTKENGNGYGNGLGLLNIKERTESLGGVLKIDSSAENGLSIIAEIPFPQSM